MEDHDTNDDDPLAKQQPHRALAALALPTPEPGLLLAPEQQLHGHAAPGSRQRNETPTPPTPKTATVLPGVI